MQNNQGQIIQDELPIKSPIDINDFFPLMVHAQR